MAARNPGKKSTRKKSPENREAKPVLGNDPFERGAAVREVQATLPAVAARPSTSTPPGGDRAGGPSALSVAPPDAARSRRAPTSTPTPTVTSAAAVLRDRLDALEQRAESAAAGAAARLRDLALQEAAGQHARDLGEALARLLPALRGRLTGLAALRGVFASPAPGALDAYGMDRDLLARARPALDFLYASWWRVETRQIEHVPSSGPVIVVANHGGALAWDALVLRMALLREHPSRRDLRPLLDDRALGAPIFGRAAARLGAIAATPEHALGLLGEGAALAVFPEGSRNAGRPWPERYRVDRFGRGGFARIALRTGATIVPCAIVGSEETSAPFARAGWLAEQLGMPFLVTTPSLPLAPLGVLPLPSRWSLRFGEPIDTAALGRAAAEDAPQVLALTERTRSALQQMLDEDVAARRSVYL